MEIGEYKISYNKINYPLLLIKDNYPTNRPLDILNHGLYDIPKYKNIQVFFLKNINSSYSLDKLQEFTQNFFNPSEKDFPSNTKIKKFSDLFGVDSEKDVSILYDDNKRVTLSEIKEKLDICGSEEDKQIFLIVHQKRIDKINEKEFYEFKKEAINKRCRTQFVDVEHILENNNYVRFNVWLQLAAKMNGTPWLVQKIKNNETDITTKALDNLTLLIGIAFSAIQSGVTYGTVTFLDIRNQVQQIKIFSFERNPAERYLYLNKKEFLDIINKGLAWFKEQVGYSAKKDDKADNKIKIYIYKTTPLHNEEKAAIDEILNDHYNILNADKIELTHVHVKSPNFGLPRMYNIKANSYLVEKGMYVTINPAASQSDNKFDYKGDIVFFTTGAYNNTSFIGTPKPLFLSVHSSISEAMRYVLHQIPFLNLLDWEAGINIYRAREPALIKYARRMAHMINVLHGASGKSPIFNTTLLDIRDLM